MKWWLEPVIGALVLAGLWVTLDKLSTGILRAWARWRDRRESGTEDESGCACCEDGGQCYGVDPQKCGQCGHPETWHVSSLEELPPERTWEQITSHKAPVVGMSPAERKHWQKLERGRKRLASAAELEHRAAYEACGFDYPSGLMARVREAAS